MQATIELSSCVNDQSFVNLRNFISGLANGNIAEILTLFFSKTVTD